MELYLAFAGFNLSAKPELPSCLNLTQSYRDNKKTMDDNNNQPAPSTDGEGEAATPEGTTEGGM